jgi:hypothetical protein
MSSNGIDPMLIETPEVLAEKKSRWMDIFDLHPEAADYILQRADNEGGIEAVVDDLMSYDLVKLVVQGEQLVPPTDNEE